MQNLQKKKTVAIFTIWGQELPTSMNNFKKYPSKLRKKTMQEQIPQVKPSKVELLKATTESSRI